MTDSERLVMGLVGMTILSVGMALVGDIGRAGLDLEAFAIGINLCLMAALIGSAWLCLSGCVALVFSRRKP